MGDNQVFFATHHYEFPTPERAGEAREWLAAGNSDTAAFLKKFPGAKQVTWIGASQTLAR
jgi:hypothetical protein